MQNILKIVGQFGGPFLLLVLIILGALIQGSWKTTPDEIRKRRRNKILILVGAPIDLFLIGLLAENGNIKDAALFWLLSILAVLVCGGVICLKLSIKEWLEKGIKPEEIDAAERTEQRN